MSKGFNEIAQLDEVEQIDFTIERDEDVDVAFRPLLVADMGAEQPDPIRCRFGF